MTNPTITYGHGLLNDCTDISEWDENLNNMIDADATLSAWSSQQFRIAAVTDEVDKDEYCYYQYPKAGSPLSINTNIYKKIMVRWATNTSSNGVGARVGIYYDAAWHYICVGAANPEFNTTWTVSTGDLPAGKTIQYIGLFADDYPDSCPNGTYYVYFDFVLLCKGMFTFPNYGEGLDFSPPPRYARIPVFGRVGNITQGGGSEDAVVHMSCDLDVGDDWKRPQGDTTKTDYVPAEVIYEIAHCTYTEPWQWLNTGTEQFKATLDPPVFRRGGDGHHILDLTFHEYRGCSASNELYYERFGLNL